jgi:predicted nucleic acid-binding protein
MYLLDTNVISEIRRPEKAIPAVVAWAGSIAQG